MDALLPLAGTSLRSVATVAACASVGAYARRQGTYPRLVKVGQPKDAGICSFHNSKAELPQVKDLYDGFRSFYPRTGELAIKWAEPSTHLTLIDSLLARGKYNIFISEMEDSSARTRASNPNPPHCVPSAQ